MEYLSWIFLSLSDDGARQERMSPTPSDAAVYRSWLFRGFNRRPDNYVGWLHRLQESKRSGCQEVLLENVI